MECVKFNEERPYKPQEGGRILQRNNFWAVRTGDRKVHIIYLNPKIFEKYNYSVGDEISIDAELEFFFQAMGEAGFSLDERDDVIDMSYMNHMLIDMSVSPNE